MIGQGDILKNKYRIIKKIGKGGMSVVWLAEDLDLGKLWAIKEIDKGTESYRRSVNPDESLTEVEILKKLDHPLAPRVTDIYENEESISVVMDYVAGESLQSILGKTGSLDQDFAVSVIADVCSLLSFLHSNHIVYRDIKPSNIILTKSGNIKVIDFGIAKIVFGGDYKDASAFGTKGYASPEHTERCTTELSDIYSAGVTLYQLLTGIPPSKKGFCIMPLASVRPGLSSGFDEIIAKATRNNPKERYQSADELADALRNYKSLEKPYIERVKRKIAVSKWLLCSSVVFISVGLLGYEALEFAEVRKYKALLNMGSFNTSSYEESCIKAIELRPENTDAFLSLLDIYNEDFTLERLAKFKALYEEYYEPNVILKSARYCELNYRAAESILFYGDNSGQNLKTRLAEAESFFKRASVKETEYYESSCIFLAVNRYFSICEQTLELTDSDAKDIIKTLNSLVTMHDQSFGKGTMRKKLTSYNLALQFIAENIDLLRSAGSLSDVIVLTKKIEGELRDIPSKEDYQAALDEAEGSLNLVKQLVQ